MKEKIHRYEGADLVVAYDVRRCIHARACVRGLPAVFDPARRPWVDPDEGEADAVAEVVLRCPTGALRFARKDGVAAESIPEKNTVTIDPDGPLYVRGDVEITLPDGTVLLRDTRLALCRCGASQNKPLCDNSHAGIGFKDAGVLREVKVRPEQDGADGVLRVRPSRNGPLLVQGSLELCGAEASVRGSQAVLCRCGGSANKPFCDGTHKQNGFESE